MIANAAEVATSRPRSVTVVTTRRKARRFYGPLVNEVEEVSVGSEAISGCSLIITRTV